MFDELLKFFVVLFVVVEPLSLLPILAGLTSEAGDAYRRRMSVKAVTIAAIVSFVFAICGGALLRVLGISVDAFKVGGGVLLFLLAIEMVFARPSGARSTTPNEEAECQGKADISVFPLAFPLIAGPGTLAVILLAFAAVPAGSPQFFGQLVAIALVLAITLVLMLLTTRVMRLIGVTGGAVLGRLFGVLLAALAAQFVIDGVRGAMGVP
jgi:multiple antibiotic resistance protein